MKTVAIIQARMNSTRLPGKVMLPLADTTVLGVVCRRVAAAHRVNEVVVATSRATADTAVERWCVQNRVSSYRGSEDDVLGRVYEAARMFHADAVVDVTADCPLVDPRHIDALVERFATDRGTAVDYVSNCIIRNWPDGLDVQVYTFDALRAIHGYGESVREHTGWNIHRFADALGLHVRQPMAPPRYARPQWGLTLDEPRDYELLRRVFAEMTLRHGDALFPVEAALDWLAERPEVLAINAGVVRKEPGNG